jgi:membrane peptidoglycan carboxypeptidase
LLPVALVNSRPSKHQLGPGSSFKPYVYEAALMSQKFTVDSTLDDTPQNFSGYSPNDYDNSYLGQMCLKTALDLSRNLPAIETASKVGMGPIIDLATKMGIRDPLDPTLPTAIGGSAVTLFDHVQGYQVFADNGTRVPVHGVAKVVDGSGETIYSADPQAGQSQVLTPARGTIRWRARPAPPAPPHSRRPTPGSWPTTRMSSSAPGSATRGRTGRAAASAPTARRSPTTSWRSS